MKRRSHRHPSHDKHEDWVNGSWTVDCVCGVDFDDGEEMVNCDECGVWVHTRCSRYVKGEESFACDKCKSRNNKEESEETEVAQLLVELPTKTIRLESSYAAASGPATRPFRLWTDMPMEERVHVQGIPGGDPALFTGLSVFTPELWKCAGYVPKKFNFHYREFPCWDEEGSRNEEDHKNTVDKGAGVLFSLAKETVFATPAAALVGMRARSEEGTLDRKVYSKERKNWVNGDNDVSHSQIEVKKERSLLRPIVIHSGKRKKEDLAMPKERSGKKKARATYKEVDLKKRVSHVSKTALTSTSDAKPLNFYEDGRPKSIKNDNQRSKNKNLGDSTGIDSESDYNVSAGNGLEKSKNRVPVRERSSETLCADISRHDYATGVKLNERKATHKGSSKFRNLAASTPENIVQKLPVEREGDNALNGNIDANVESSLGCDVKPATDGLVATLSEAKDNQIKGDDDMSSGSLQPNVKSDADDDNLSRLLNGQSSVGDTKDNGAPNNGINENLKMDNIPLSSSSSGHYKTQETERASEAVGDCHASKHTEIASDHLKIKRELEGSEGRTPLQKCSSEPKLGSASPSELSKSSETTFHSSALPIQNKIVLCLEKSSSALATVMVSKSSVSDTARSADNLDSNPSTKQQAPAECNSSIKKDRAASDTVKLKDEDSHDMSRKAAKECLKPSVNSTSKASNSSKISHTSILKRAHSDSKDSALHSSSKTSLAQNSSEATGSLQNECPSQVQNKAGLPLRGEKLNHCSSQSSSKGNHVPSAHPPVTNSSAALSDEELALLLHQELNSSPRVPRVPRVRHPGSLASPSATSMLIKRTSGYGGRDHNLVHRRKNKDAFKDGFARAHEPDDGAKKTDKGPSSPDLGRQDTGCTADELPKREDIGSLAPVHSVKKNVLSTSTSTSIVNSGLSSSTEINGHHLSSVRNSPRNMSDEEIGIVQVPVHRTLPGLINEIMSKGQRMTYEELCNAVLPHWHNLRKHNGERYAYSSHSQAVLDCLRNRHEWAQLVDRGPKTNSSRKRRKLDAEESEDNDYGKGKPVKEGDSKSLESQRDEFPKGKRKARKRRRLALQGRGIKELRRRKADLGSDDDSGPFSNSSDESLLSDNEIRGRGGGPVGSDASASSDETGTT